MSTAVNVNLWGTRIGAVLYDENTSQVLFEYDPDFVKSGIELAPLMMPLSSGTYSFPNVPEHFLGLPGLLADSLPDKYGNTLTDAWLASIGRTSLTVIERLCYVGKRSMGALEYEPVLIPELHTQNDVLHIEQLVQLASEILTQRKKLKTTLRSNTVRHILQIGTSAGGARAKALIAWNPKTNEIRSGQINAGADCEYWLLKFDGVHDKELLSLQGYGAIEYAYYKMATDCGIVMNECRLFEEGGRRHFMTRRFDRTTNGDKIHMQTLAALAHFDFHRPGYYSYEQVFDVMHRLNLSAKEKKQFFKRMVFNVIARNQDDHVKNIAFLMDRRGQWTLAPAYDVAYSVGQHWTASHQMTIGNKRENFLLEDFIACGKIINLKQKAVEQIISEIQQVVRRWTDYAEDCHVLPKQRDKIQPALVLSPFQY